MSSTSRRDGSLTLSVGGGEGRFLGHVAFSVAANRCLILIFEELSSVVGRVGADFVWALAERVRCQIIYFEMILGVIDILFARWAMERSGGTQEGGLS